MQDDLLPLFPLALVLLPGADLPLHIFEERYKEMIGRVLANGAEFGVVLAVKDGIARTGCTASVDRVLQRYEDGRMDILTSGRRRFTIESVNQDKDYLRGEVSFFDDRDVAVPPELRQQALRVCSALAGSEDADPETQQLSFRLAASIRDLDFKQSMLNLRSESERLKLLIQFVPGYADRMKTAAHMQEVAPRNGHGKLPRSVDPS